MNVKCDDLFASQHLHRNGGVRLQLRQTLHIVIHIRHGLTVDLLNDVTATDTGLMGGLACHYDVGTKTGNTTGAHYNQGL